jgi:hypothetical protein
MSYIFNLFYWLTRDTIWKWGILKKVKSPVPKHHAIKEYKGHEDKTPHTLVFGTTG